LVEKAGRPQQGFGARSSAAGECFRVCDDGEINQERHPASGIRHPASGIRKSKKPEAGRRKPYSRSPQIEICEAHRPAYLVAIVIVLVPIALGVPAVLVFIPPLMAFAPAALPRLVQFATLVVCLSAVASVALDGFVQVMLRVLDAALTPLLAFGVKTWDGGKEQDCG
jgi:hypothetical protein